MSHIKGFPYNIPISIALVLGLAIVHTTVATAPSAATNPQGTEKPSIAKVKDRQLAQSNPPPPPSNPGSSSAGGRRDPSHCPQDPVPPPNSLLLTALSPMTQPGSTLAERPTFLVYVPKTSAKNAEFSLRRRDGRGVYRTMVALTNTPALISIPLLERATPLELGQSYVWSFALICTPNDRLKDRFVTGMVQRIALDPTRLQQIQRASLKEQVGLYQTAGLWYDALALLFQLKRSQPNDPSLGTAWRELLQAQGVNPLIDSSSEPASPW